MGGADTARHSCRRRQRAGRISGRPVDRSGAKAPQRARRRRRSCSRPDISRTATAGFSTRATQRRRWRLSPMRPCTDRSTRSSAPVSSAVACRASRTWGGKRGASSTICWAAPRPASLHLPDIMPSVLQVDWRQVRRWHIDEKLIPTRCRRPLSRPHLLGGLPQRGDRHRSPSSCFRPALIAKLLVRAATAAARPSWRCRSSASSLPMRRAWRWPAS